MTLERPAGFGGKPMRHFMVLWGIAEEFGGMTTMSLYRASMFRRGGEDAAVITLDPKPDYPGLLARLAAQGKIDDGVPMLNPYLHCRDCAPADLPRTPKIRDVPKDQGDVGESEDLVDGEGMLFSRVLHRPDGKTAARREYFRRDGTPFLLDESPRTAEGGGRGRYLTVLDPSGTPVGQWRSTAAFYRHWLGDLAAGGPTALIVDSAYVVPFIAPLRQPGLLKFVVLHNSHVAAGGDPYRGQLASGQKAIHEDVNAWDGLVFLTDSHRRDYEARFGSAGNLVTVSNPKQPLEHLPDHAGRSPRRGVLLGRLAPQKNLAHAVRVMAKVRESVPDAVLDIYGKGAQEAELRSLIDELELQGTVRLRGHVPRAVAEFDSAGFSLLTSRNEGQPLALLESMGHGCPAVAYDIRYGPSDVVDDGVNGFLVPAGDIDAAARRVVELCTDTEMAARMGAAAWRSAGRYADAEVLSRWREVLGQAWDRQSSRSRVHTLELAEKAYRLLGSGTIEMECAVTWQQDAGAPFEREVAGDVLAVPRKTGSPVVLPLRFGERKPGGVACTVVWDPALVDGLVEAPETILDLFLRLRTGDVLRSFRLAVPVAPDAFLPYADPEQGLSIQRLGA